MLSELEKLIEDYYTDMFKIADQMRSWCEPTPETIAKITRMKKKATKGRKALKGKK